MLDNSRILKQIWRRIDQCGAYDIAGKYSLIRAFTDFFTFVTKLRKLWNAHKFWIMIRDQVPDATYGNSVSANLCHSNSSRRSRKSIRCDETREPMFSGLFFFAVL